MSESHEHAECYACHGTDGYYPTDPQHDDCVGRCDGGPSWIKAREGSCPDPCPCECNKPLTRNEIMEMRDIIGKFRR